MVGNTLMSLLVNLGVDAGDLEKGLLAAEKSSKVSTKNIASGMSMAGAGVLSAFTIMGGAAVAFFASTIGPASSLSEATSKVGVVFGDTADEVIAFAETAADALGLARGEALAAAGTYGNLFRAMGIGTEASKDMSIGLTELAADLGSFNDMDVTTVLDSLRAGLSGETEPLKKLGINLNAAMIEQKALTMGLWDGVGAIDAAAKAQATYSLIMEQTTLAQGDYARTSGGFANIMKSLSATFMNIKESVGTALLPVLEKLGGMLKDGLGSAEFKAFLDEMIAGLTDFAGSVVEAIPVVLEWFGKVKQWFTENEGAIVAVLAIIGAAVAAFVYSVVIPAAWSVITALSPILLVFALIGAAAWILYEAWNSNFLGIQDLVMNLWAAIQPIFMAVWDWLQVKWAAAIAFLSDLWQTKLYPAIKMVIKLFETYAMPIIAKVAEIIKNVLIARLKLMVAAFQWVWGKVKEVWSLIVTSTITVIKKVNEWLIDKFGIGIAGFMSGLRDGIVAGLNWAIQKVEDFVNGVIRLYNKLAEASGGMLTPIDSIEIPDIDLADLDFTMFTNVTGDGDDPFDLGSLGDGYDKRGSGRDMSTRGSDDLYDAGVGGGGGGGGSGGGGAADEEWYDDMLEAVEEIREKPGVDYDALAASLVAALQTSGAL